MTAQELKNSILQYAVQGKLVPQDPNDEPASELLKRIQAEKQQLIKDKKIKAEKPLLQIKEDEIPFEIPESWVWVRLSEIVNYNMGKTPPRKESIYWDKSDYNWVSIADLVSDGYVKHAKEQVNDYSFDNIFKKRIVPKGTLLMSFKLTVGKVSILDIDSFHNEAIISIFPFIDTDKITTNYLFKGLPIFSKLGDTKSAIKGNTLNSDSLNSLLIPLPPLAEQQRIVDKIEELMPMVEEYDKAEKELTGLNKAFPEQIKKSILQYAIQGKLVPQNPQDEPASALLAKIKAEKAQLIKDKKIKAEKPLPPITEEEKPFEIPESWEWVRLKDAVNQIADIDHKMPIKTAVGIPFISPRDFYGINDIDFSNAHKISVESYEKLSKKIKPSKYDIIFPRYGTIGVCRYIEVEQDFLVSYSCVTINTNKLNTYPKYIYYYCMSPFAKSEIEKYTVKTTQPNVGIASIGQFLIPLPPLTEQKLIVEKVEELLAECEKLQRN